MTRYHEATCRLLGVTDVVDDVHYGPDGGRHPHGAGLLTEGLLVIRTEDHGVCHWAVPLGEGGDPRVLVEVNSDPSQPEWHLHARSFTEYVYTLAWDLTSFSMPYGVAAQEAGFARQDRLLLEAGFRQQPQTYAPPRSRDVLWRRHGTTPRSRSARRAAIGCRVLSTADSSTW